jgi:hypothetical protein
MKDPRCFVIYTRFVRYPYARPTSSNRFVELGRFFYNLISGIFQFFNLIHYSIATFNNMLSSLPFFLRSIVHGILAFCVPFYSVYQAGAMLINRIHGITYPIYRVITLFIRLFTFFITLPIRIITYVTTQTQVLLKNLLIILIFASIIIGLIVLFSNDQQSNYIKSYLRNTTNVLLKYTSMV